MPQHRAQQQPSSRTDDPNSTMDSSKAQSTQTLPTQKGKEKSRPPKVEKLKLSKPPKLPKEAPKKAFKIVVRKLPVRDFTAENFETKVHQILEALGLENDAIEVEHFMQGKLRYFSIS